MAEIDKNNLTEVENNKKVEVLLKREEGVVETELNLLNVFSNMNKKKNIYVWIIILFMLIGLSIPMYMAEHNKETERVSALITFLYPDAKRQKTPDGKDLNIRYITSSYVLQNALKKTKLTNNPSISAIERNITIETLLAESTRKNLEVLQKVTETNKNFASVSDLKYQYDGKYIITLSNGFSTASDTVYLSGNELSNLLNNIIESYNEYFFMTYSNMTLPDNNLDSIINSDLDYIERLDEIIKLFNSLSAYCTDKTKKEYLTYRSKKDGLSFLDLNDYIKLTKDIDVDYLYSYIFANNITKGKQATLTKFEYNLTNTEREFNAILASIENNSSLITEYKNDNIAISLSEEAANKTGSIVTDYYNRLIINQADYYEKKAELGEQIANLNYKISGFNSNKNDQSQINYVEKEIEKLKNSCKIIYDLTKEHAEEIIESASYKNSFISYIGSQYKGNSIFNTANIKKVLTGMFAGIFIAIFLWGLDGLIVEIKASSHKKEEE